MRIAQVAPLFESVPPKLYGGTERVVFHLTEALIALGHEVTLFASADSLTSATLVECCPQALRLGKCIEPLAPHYVEFEKLRSRAEEFDLIHLHTELMHMGLTKSLGCPAINTLHGRLDIPEYQEFFSIFRDFPLTSISMNQRTPLPFVNWVGNVYHGLDPEMTQFNESGGDYLAFLGRISPEKGVEEAIEIARRSGLKIKIAAKIDHADQKYYERVEPLLQEPFVEYIGEINDREKPEFLGGAKALIFPIQWPEPFGIVMIEALSAGTPVVAFKNGSVPEVIRDGVTGFVVSDVESAVSALARIDLIDRGQCRQEFMNRFTRERMARSYVEIYESLVIRPGDEVSDENYATSVIPWNALDRLEGPSNAGSLN